MFFNRLNCQMTAIATKTISAVLKYTILFNIIDM